MFIQISFLEKLHILKGKISNFSLKRQKLPAGHLKLEFCTQAAMSDSGALATMLAELTQALSSSIELSVWLV